MSNATERKLTVHELGFLDLDTRERPQIVSGVVCLSGPIEFKLFRERMQRFVLGNPQYQCRIDLSHLPEWKFDEDFDLSNHCVEIELNFASTENILTYVSNEATRGLDDGQPPWRIAIIHGKSATGLPDQFAIAIWAHHALVDGLEGMKLLGGLVDSCCTSGNSASSHKENGKVTASKVPPVVSANCVRVLARDVMRREIKSPISGTRSRKRQTLSFSWSRKVFKNARSQLNTTFQEVLLAVLTDGLANYCGRHSRRRNLRAVLPLGRPAGESSGFLSNRHDVGFIDLPLKTSNWQVRMKKIRCGLCSLRRQQQAQVFPTILSFLGQLPGVVRSKIARRWSAQSDILISVLPGGTTRHRIGGVDVQSLFAQPAMPPHHAVVIGVIATRHNVCVTVQVDPEVIGNPQDLKADLSSAYASIAA